MKNVVINVIEALGLLGKEEPQYTREEMQRILADNAGKLRDKYILCLLQLSAMFYLAQQEERHG